MRDVRRAGERFLTRREGIETWHAFSYGDHYDPANVAFGPVIAVNEERVPPGGGYAPHRHADVEIVTWVLEGALAHEDTTGEGGIIRPGTAQRLSAGSGAQHGERNASADEPLVFVQMMLRSTHEEAPEYAAVDVPDGPGVHATVPVHADAELLVVRPAGTTVTVPSAPRALVHVACGTVEVDGLALGPGDALRLADEPAPEFTGDGEALVWLLSHATTA